VAFEYDNEDPEFSHYDLESDAYLRSLGATPVEALCKLCADFHKSYMRQYVEQQTRNDADAEVDFAQAQTLAAFALLSETLCNSARIHNNLGPMLANYTAHALNFGQAYSVIKEIQKACDTVHRRSLAAKAEYVLQAQFAPEYTLTDGDIQAIQHALNELRTLIQGTDAITCGHKQRLLKALEILQKELHKRMSSLDAFWGFFGRLAPVIKENGEATQAWIPLLKQIKEIIWNSEARAAELPSTDLPPKDFLPEPHIE
jgi:hypothetical protein